MLERPDANSNLMEELYDSAIPELLATNCQTIKYASHMAGTNHAIDRAELEVTPGFMIGKNRNLLVDPGIQREIATEVLTGLHEAMGGSEITEYAGISDVVLKYWKFEDAEDDSRHWIVVEEHDISGENTKKAQVLAYLLPGEKCPPAYQKLLDKKIDTYGNELSQTVDLVKNEAEHTNAYKNKPVERVTNILRKLAKPPKNSPSNRWY